MATELPDPRVIVALDYPTEDAALAFAARVSPSLCRLKVGLELYISAGPRIVELLIERGFEVFLDLKFHDIPNTVAAVCRVAAGLGVWMVNVHLSGGRGMVEAARQALRGSNQPPRLIGVTMLTSLGEADLAEIGITSPLAQQVQALARLAQRSGLDGVVCSAREARALRQILGDDFDLVCPGIRAAGEAGHDQRRTMTAEEAAGAGADYLVVGRPVTAAADPQTTLRSLRAGFCRGRERYQITG